MLPGLELIALVPPCLVWKCNGENIAASCISVLVTAIGLPPVLVNSDLVKLLGTM